MWAPGGAMRPSTGAIVGLTIGEQLGQTPGTVPLGEEPSHDVSKSAATRTIAFRDMPPSISTRPAPQPWRPSKEELAAARDKKLRDVIGPGLSVLFCGINPGLYSGATGHHFARPGNRFWPALHGSGFTPRLLSPFEDRALLELGLGVTNVVNRTTATADELGPEELVRGAKALKTKVRKHRPRCLAVLGMQAYRIGFGHKGAGIGLQDETIGASQVWLLPNPSGLNAHYQLPRLIDVFEELRRHIGAVA